MENYNQQEENLMQYMPIDDKGSAMMKKGCSAANYGSPMKMGGSWMSKHCQSAINYGSPMHQEIDPKSGKKHTGKKVKIVTPQGVEREIDTRSQYYKSLQNRKKNKQEETDVVLDKSGKHYTGLRKK